MDESVGERIRNARKSAKMTQQELAEKSGMAVNTIRRFEGGKVTPRIGDFERLADALGMTREGLLSSDKSIPVTITEPDGTTSSALLVRFPKGHPMHVPTLQEERENRRAQLLAHFDALNYAGQGIAVERIGELAEMPRYKREGE